MGRSGLEPFLHDKYYWGYCIVCKKVGTPSLPLKRCAGCHAAYYCSKEHQKGHWKEHKRACTFMKAYARVRGAQTYFMACWTDRKKYKKDVKAAFALPDGKCSKGDVWQICLFGSMRTAEECFEETGGKMKMAEMEMFLFPRACRVCWQPKPEGMIDCADCMCVSYCSDEHKRQDATEHARVCSELKYSMMCDIYEMAFGMEFFNFPSFIDVRFDKKDYLENDMKSFMIGQSSLKKLPSLPERDARLLSNLLSGPLTILYACLRIPHLASKVCISESKELTIHIVGSAGLELIEMAKWEYLSHLLWNLKKYRVVFIGPNLDPRTMSRKHSACKTCAMLDRAPIFEFREMLYQDYVKKGKAKGYYTKPDVVVAFNCGFHESAGMDDDTWSGGFEYMVREVGVPCVFTSYTAFEASKDLTCFKKALRGNNKEGKVKYEIIGAKNPFRSLRPLRSMVTSPFDNCDVFYHNQYLTVARRVSQ